MSGAVLTVPLVVLLSVLGTGGVMAQKTPKKAGGESSNAAASGGSRLDVIEQQMIDMQVAIGTLESFSRGGGGNTGVGSAPLRSPASGMDQGRADALEMQMRALTSQVDQLSQQIRQLQQQRSAVGVAAPVVAGAAGAPPAVLPAPSLYASVPGVATGGAGAAGSGVPDNDPIGRMLNRGGQVRAGAAVVGRPAEPVAATDAPRAGLPRAIDANAAPKDVYEIGYGYLLAQDFASAEAVFDEFLRRFPQDALAGNAQYWLGETFFVRGQYQPAASAFYKGYQTYGQSAKAPDSLLKLAMSLDKMGQKQASCASFGELSTKFPTAPEDMRRRASAEQRRLGCG